MKRLLRGLIAAPVVIIGLLWAGPALAADPRIPLPAPEPFTLEGYCDFPVLVEFQDVKQYIIHSTTAADGTVTLQITGRARVTLTNLSPGGDSVSYNISGPGTVVLYPNGSIKSADLAGPNLLWTLPEFSYPGVPAISYTTGHVTFEVAASGQTTSYSLAGGSRQTDVCAVLAS